MNGGPDPKRVTNCVLGDSTTTAGTRDTASSSGEITTGTVVKTANPLISLSIEETNTTESMEKNNYYFCTNNTTTSAELLQKQVQILEIQAIEVHQTNSFTADSIVQFYIS
jgi:hypothetical protein